MLKTICSFLLAMTCCCTLFADTPIPPPAPIQQTLSIIKPDATKAHNIGAIVSYLEKGGLNVVGMKMLRLTPELAGKFYSVHQKMPFYPALVSYMSSGPVVAMVLEGPNAVARNREIMGATDPLKAAVGTIRKDFGTSISANAVHGSDSVENAQKEIAFFFADYEIQSSLK